MDYIILNFIFLAVLPFLFIGVINKTKAFWAGSRGQPILQPYYDFIKLFRKGEVVSKTVTWVFNISPSINLGCVVLAGLLVPMVSCRQIFGFSGDFILFSYILATGKFFSIIASLDTGSSFEGMGASREVTFSTLVEPAFFIIISSFVFVSGYLSFGDISIWLDSNRFSYPVAALSVCALLIMLLTEGCRVPVDDPNTHLELTMIHEVMVLDNCGPNLAIINYAAAMKMFIISSLMANLIMPLQLNLTMSALIFTGIIFLFALLVGTIESLMARFRMTHVPQFVFFMTVMAMLILSSAIFFKYSGVR